MSILNVAAYIFVTALLFFEHQSSYTLHYGASLAFSGNVYVGWY